MSVNIKSIKSDNDLNNLNDTAVFNLISHFLSDQGFYVGSAKRIIIKVTTIWECFTT